MLLPAGSFGHHDCGYSPLELNRFTRLRRKKCSFAGLDSSSAPGEHRPFTTVVHGSFRLGTAEFSCAMGRPIRFTQPVVGLPVAWAVTSWMQIDPDCGTRIDLPFTGIETMFGGVVHLNGAPAGADVWVQNMSVEFSVTCQSWVQSITTAFFSPKKNDIATSIWSGTVEALDPASIRTSASYRWLSSQKSMFPSTHSFAPWMSCRSWLPRVLRLAPPPGAAT